MLAKNYEDLAKKITGMYGKYIGHRTVKLIDGSKIMLGDIVAVQVIDNDIEYGSIMYEKIDGEWTSSTTDAYEKKNHNNVRAELLDNVFTFSEAAEKWGLCDGSVLRNAIKNGRFNEDEYRQSGSVWLVTKDGMKRVYGEQK